MTSVWAWLQEAWTNRALEAILAGAVGATLGALLTGFFTEWGKQFAVTRNLEKLQKQLTENTELTKRVEARILMEDWFEKGQFEHLCQQLSQLYGPLYGHLITTGDLYDLWRDRKIDAMNLPIKKLLEEQNTLIINLIRSNVHLLDEGEMPPCLTRLITSALVWNLYCPTSEEGKIPPELAEDLRVKFPVEAIQYVVQKTEEIKKKRDHLYSRFEARQNTTIPTGDAKRLLEVEQVLTHQ